MPIELKNVTYKYESRTKNALEDVSVTFSSEDFTAIIGPTGSGKSTLIQHLDGLLHATSGDVLFDGESIYDKGYDKKKLRSNVGIVFQYPEYQLFESTVFDDVAFGPKCLGFDENEIKERVEKSLELVGMTPEQYERSPFELSGGQRRRAAIAGVLAMSPKYLVLDEPAAGLDPQGRRDILGLMRALHDEHGIGIILVSHSMEDVAEYADRVIVLHDGHIEMDGSPKEVFADSEHLFALGLDIPQVTALMKKLKERGLIVDEGIISEEEAVSEILKALYYTGR